MVSQFEERTESKESKGEDENKVKDEIKDVFRQLVKEERDSKTPSEMLEESKSNGNSTTTLLYIAGFLSSVICIIAGLSMTAIQSVAGNTVAEAYYNAVGVFVIGIGFFVGPLLFGIASLIKKND